jgi:hypothetical protein
MEGKCCAWLFNQPLIVLNRRRGQMAAPPVQSSAKLEIYDPQESQNDEDDGNHQQGMNPTTGLREARADVSTEKAKQPEDEQDNNNGPQHEISPFQQFVRHGEGEARCE